MRLTVLVLIACFLVLVVTESQNRTRTSTAQNTTALPSQKIRLGNVTHQNGFPWMVHLQSTYRSATRRPCTGSLIHPRWVITAAHCVRTLVANRIVDSSLRLTFGKYDLANHEPSQVSAVARWNRGDILVHPQYNVALVRVRRRLRLRLDNNINGIELLDNSCMSPDQYSSAVDGCSRAVAASWGSAEPGDPSNLLRKVSLASISFSSSQLLYGMNYTASQVNALGVAGQDTCQGKSGGPLMCFNNATQRHQLFGVTSSGDKCYRNRGFLGIYTPICQIIDWIRSRVPKWLRPRGQNVTNPRPAPPPSSVRRQCPNTAGTIGNCMINKRSCWAEEHCQPWELCCPIGCGAECMLGVVA